MYRINDCTGYVSKTYTDRKAAKSDLARERVDGSANAYIETLDRETGEWYCITCKRMTDLHVLNEKCGDLQ